jgi:hypothetical protein
MLAAFLFKSSATEKDRKTAQSGAHRYALIVQRNTLTSLSDSGGASTRTDSSEARKKMADFLLTSEEENRRIARTFGEYALGDSQTLKDAIEHGYTDNLGPFVGIESAEYNDALEDPSEFASVLSVRFQFMGIAAQTLFDMHVNRIDVMTEKSGMSADEVFELARENRVNLFADPENFLQIMVDLGLDWTDSDRQAPGVNLDSKYLEELSRDSSGYFDALIDSLGSFFNACKQC